MAQYEGDELVYKGNVGTGFTTDELDELAAKMKRLERKTPPVETDSASARGVTWLTRNSSPKWPFPNSPPTGTSATAAISACVRTSRRKR